ncbi:MAG: hypothetical protein PVG11_03415 [Anaerolineae bacterium]|jgi:hypothetical protein
MVEFIGEPVSVEARERPDGRLLPSAFSWQGRRYVIRSWGREGPDSGRTGYCYLVQTAGPESWELCHDATSGAWTLARRWPGRYAAV